MKLDINEYVGKRIHCVEVVGVDTSKSHANANTWLFRCECGNVFSAPPSRVISGHKKSCGCKKINSVKTHGCNGDPFYPTWYAMMQRCYNPEHHKYESYGARGIKVCAEWHEPSVFISWANKTAGAKQANLTLDRKDNGGNYSPENCRWATPKEQALNRRSTKMITFNGTTKPFVSWCEFYNISPAAVRARLKLGWTLEDALKTPVCRGKKYQGNRI